MISMSGISFSDEIDILSLLQIIVKVQSIYTENKVFFDLFSVLVMLMPTTADNLKTKCNISNIEVLSTI